MNKKISIIIPTKNRQEFLKNALKSFKSFSEKLEIIVVDDGSSREEASSNRKNCTTISDCQYIYFPKSTGAAAARNYGLDMSSTDYIWFVDDDDFVPIKAIKDVLCLVIPPSFSSQAILLPITLMSNEIVIRKIVPSQEKNTFAKYRDIGHQVSTSAAIFSKNILLKVGGWDNSLSAGQDTDLFLRVSQLTNFHCFSTEPVIQNVGHPQRITRAVLKQEIGKIQFLIKHWQILSVRRRIYYILSFIVVAPLLNEPSIYRLKVRLLRRHYS